MQLISTTTLNTCHIRLCSSLNAEDNVTFGYYQPKVRVPRGVTLLDSTAFEKEKSSSRSFKEKAQTVRLSQVVSEPMLNAMRKCVTDWELPRVLAFNSSNSAASLQNVIDLKERVRMEKGGLKLLKSRPDSNVSLNKM